MRVPEWFPIIGKRSEAPVAPDPASPFNPTAAPVQTLTESQPITASGVNSSVDQVPNPMVGVDVSSPVSGIVSAEPIIASPTTMEQAPAAPLNDSAKDSAIGLAAMSNSFPGTVMKPPQEVPTQSPPAEETAA